MFELVGFITWIALLGLAIVFGARILRSCELSSRSPVLRAGAICSVILLATYVIYSNGQIQELLLINYSRPYSSRPATIGFYGELFSSSTVSIVMVVLAILIWVPLNYPRTDGEKHFGVVGIAVLTASLYVSIVGWCLAWTIYPNDVSTQAITFISCFLASSIVNLLLLVAFSKTLRALARFRDGFRYWLETIVARPMSASPPFVNFGAWKASPIVWKDSPMWKASPIKASSITASQITPGQVAPQTSLSLVNPDLSTFGQLTVSGATRSLLKGDYSPAVVLPLPLTPLGPLASDGNSLSRARDDTPFSIAHFATTLGNWVHIFGSLPYPVLVLLIALTAFGGLVVTATFITISIWVLAPLFAMTAGVDIGQFMGNAIVASNVFITSLLGLSWLLRAISNKLGLSLGGLLLLLALLLSLFDKNDNHKVRETRLNSDAEREAKTEPITLESAFEAWLRPRKEVWSKERGSTRYPVYVVAARGGGIYAAAQAATFLSNVQDLVPAFSNHLFAVSAISGGSLGAGIFSALVDRHTQERAKQVELGERWYTNNARSLLSQDFLSSVTAAALFTDLTARVLPCLGDGILCPGLSLGRAPAFERSIELAWENVFPESGQSNPFVKSLAESWDPTGKRPLLLLGTTEVETGDQVTVASVSLRSANAGEHLVSLRDRAPNLTISMSTAIGLSARFPGLMPAGWYYAAVGKEVQKRRLVDGGYYDNSGVSAAQEVISRLAPKYPDVRFNLIALVGEATNQLEDPPGYGFGEILSPLRALDSTRTTRSKLFVAQAELRFIQDVCIPNHPCLHGAKMKTAILASGKRHFPLGWTLSSESQGRIEGIAGYPEACSAANHFTDDTYATAHRHNSCVVGDIAAELTSSTPRAGSAR